MHLARLLSFCALLVACGPREGDTPPPFAEPPPAGKDHRIHEIADPNSPDKATHHSQVAVSGAVVIAVDRHDETGNGRSSGTIYVADLGSHEPYSGLSLFNPSFIPGNLRVGPGDALDLRGEFQENQDVPIKFADGAFLVQLANPIGTFRFDAYVPDPVEIKVKDLENYDTGRKWLNMLVTVKNVTLTGAPFGSQGRVSLSMLPDRGRTECTDPFPKVPTLVNELTDISELAQRREADMAEGKDTVIKSLTGLVTFFCNLHLAPRSPDDIEL